MHIVRSNRLHKKDLLVDETIYSVSNGFIGTRGTFTEGYGTEYEYHQTYINGVYDYYDYHYEENLTGFPQTGQKFVNVLDGTKMTFTIEGKELNIENAEVVSIHRDYNLANGSTKRIMHYKMNQYDFHLEEVKLLSTEHKFVIVIDVSLSSPNYHGEVIVTSYLQESIRKQKINDPRLHTSNRSHLQIQNRDVEKGSIEYSTVRSEIGICSSIGHNIPFTLTEQEQGIVGTATITISEVPTKICKHIVHTSSLYDENYVKSNELLHTIFSSKSPIELLKTEEKRSTLFWDTSMIQIKSSAYYEQLLNYNIFQLNRQGGETHIHNIAAKGLSGEGYEGHYFWDTEIYMIPFFILTNPNKAKQLLLYRYHTLKEAKQEARNLGYKAGAKFPWRTVNGKETSPYYPAGTAQFHINSDIAYTVIKYFEATNDIEFLINFGFEILYETARFLSEAINETDGQFHLNSVTGPDEYTTVVDDNYYTNAMVRYHFKKIIDYMGRYKIELKDTIDLLKVTKEEVDRIHNISENLFLPFDQDRQLCLQDQSFMQKKRLDLTTIPSEKFPLLLHYHPLFLYKHQVLKQADTVLSHFLLDEQNEEILNNTYDYYEPITTHDSSLSKCIYSIMAFRLNRLEQASTFLKDVIETDYENSHNNTEHGLHVANLGGSYLGLIYGVAGLRIHENHVSLRPTKTKEFSDYKFSFYYHGELVKVHVGEQIIIHSTGKVAIRLFDQFIEVDKTFVSDFTQ